MCKKDTNKLSKLLGCESTIDNVYNIKPIFVVFEYIRFTWSMIYVCMYMFRSFESINLANNAPFLLSMIARMKFHVQTSL
jgi:hypothetical protein